MVPTIAYLIRFGELSKGINIDDPFLSTGLETKTAKRRVLISQSASRLPAVCKMYKPELECAILPTPFDHHDLKIYPRGIVGKIFEMRQAGSTNHRLCSSPQEIYKRCEGRHKTLSRLFSFQHDRAPMLQVGEI